jgi:hypothetical protein
MLDDLVENGEVCINQKGSLRKGGESKKYSGIREKRARIDVFYVNERRQKNEKICIYGISCHLGVLTDRCWFCNCRRYI